MRGEIQRPGSVPEGPYDFYREQMDAISHDYSPPARWSGSRMSNEPDEADYADLGGAR